jgi:hypothetical protein
MRHTWKGLDKLQFGSPFCEETTPAVNRPCFKDPKVGKQAIIIGSRRHITDDYLPSRQAKYHY